MSPLVIAVLVSFAPLVLALLVQIQKLLPLARASSAKGRVKLNFSPAKLSQWDIVIVILVFALRSLKNSIGLGPAPSTKGNDISLSMPLRLTQKDLDNYEVAARSLPGSRFQWNAPRLLLFLSAMTEPAMLLLLTHSQCNIRPLGSVKTRTRFELLRPDLATTSKLLSYERMAIVAAADGSARAAKRGYESDFEILLLVPDDSTGEPITIFRQTVTMLQFARATGWDEKQGAPHDSQQRVNWLDSVDFTVGFKDPARWAHLCKDYNPIHISLLAAKLFGQPGRLAHGNHAVARAIDALFNDASTAKTLSVVTTGLVWMDVSFRRPTVVPARLRVQIARADSRKKDGIFIPVQVTSGNKVVIEGQCGSQQRA